MRKLVAGLALASAAIGWAASAPAAYAEEPLSDLSGSVTDTTGTLSETDLLLGDIDYIPPDDDEEPADVWVQVVIVDEFENPADGAAWARETAQLSGIDDRTHLFAIALKDDSVAVATPTENPASPERLAAAVAAVESAMARDDLEGTAKAARSSFRSTQPEPFPTEAVVSVGFVVVVVVVGTVLWVRHRMGEFDNFHNPSAVSSLSERSAFDSPVREPRSTPAIARWSTAPARGPTTPLAPAKPLVPLERLQRDAAAALVATDEHLKASELEAGFAEAQFGAESTTEFRGAIEQSRAELTQAFQRKAELDDTKLNDRPDRRAGSEEILQLCSAAQDRLDEQEKAFTDLRSLEKNAPGALEQVIALRESAEAKATAADNAYRAVTQTYVAERVSSVADNAGQIRAHLAAADTHIATAKAALAADDPGAGALAITETRGALDEARRLDTSVAELAGSLAEADRQAIALIANLEADLVEAKAFSTASETFTALIARTEHELRTARRQRAHAPRDPIALVEDLQRTNKAMDEQLDRSRRRGDRPRHLSNALPSKNTP